MGRFLALFLIYTVCRVFHVSLLPNRCMVLETKHAFVVDGNHSTNLMNIGANTTTEHEFTP